MAEYPGQNDGIAPPDMSTDVGVFRALIGDMEYEEYVPPRQGRGDYAMFSDADIEGFMSAAEGNINRAVGYAYLALAGRAAAEARSVKDFDLSLDTTKRPSELRLIAQFWFDKAADDDAAQADAFFTAPLGTGCDDLIPEATLPRWGRRAVPAREC